MKRTIEAYFDGACEPRNPGGVGTYGFVLKVDGLHYASGYGVGSGGGEESTSNAAEYRGLIEALKGLMSLNLQGEDVRVRGDSRLVVNQMKGGWKVKSPRMKPFWAEALELASKFRFIEFIWVPREENSCADILTKLAYYEYCTAKDKAPKIMGGEDITHEYFGRGQSV